MTDDRAHWQIITPQQFADELLRSRHRSPEQRMCIAHLADAFSEAIDKRWVHRAVRQQAVDWIAGKLVGKMSFDLCCEALHLDSQWLRERMLKRTHDNEIQKLFRRSRRFAESKFVKKPPK